LSTIGFCVTFMHTYAVTARMCDASKQFLPNSAVDVDRTMGLGLLLALHVGANCKVEG